MNTLCRSAHRVAAGLIMLTLGLSGAVIAQPLTGSGSNLPVPPNLGVPPSEPPALALLDPNNLSFAFTGVWGPPATAPVLSAWSGTFVAFGPIPSSNLNPPGFTDYRNFAGLGATYLPSGTYFVISDVDGGSFTSETLTLMAWDTSNNPVTQPWLAVPQWVWGGAGVGDPNAMPGWSFSGGVYTFTGATVDPGYNPNVALALLSLVDLSRFTVERPSNFCNFGLRAPVPEAGSLALLAAGTAAALCRRRR